MNESKYDTILKIVIVGESSVGKTNILLRYSEDKFDLRLKSTIGMDFLSKDLYITEHHVKVQFWDSAGQEKYRSIASTYYKMASGFLLVYDVTRFDTFHKVSDWLADIQSNSTNDTKIMLVGNKTDLVEQRAVSTEQGLKFAKANNMFFWETSALTNENGCVNKAFDELINECLKDIMESEAFINNKLTNSAKNNRVDLEANKNRGMCCL